MWQVVANHFGNRNEENHTRARVPGSGRGSHPAEEIVSARTVLGEINCCPTEKWSVMIAGALEVKKETPNDTSA